MRANAIGLVVFCAVGGSSSTARADEPAPGVRSGWAFEASLGSGFQRWDLSGDMVDYRADGSPVFFFSVNVGAYVSPKLAFIAGVRGCSSGLDSDYPEDQSVRLFAGGFGLGLREHFHERVSSSLNVGVAKVSLTDGGADILTDDSSLFASVRVDAIVAKVAGSHAGMTIFGEFQYTDTVEKTEHLALFAGIAYQR